MTATQTPETRVGPHPGRAIIQGAPVVPQVNLLPPEIRASRSLARVKQVLALVLVGVLAVAVAGYFWASGQVRSAEANLAEKQEETTRLLNAQKEFAEVPQVLGQLDLATTARQLGTVNEIMWAPYLRQLITTAPPGVAFEQILYSGATPMAANPLSANPLLAGEYTGTLTWIGRSMSPVDSAAWIESLETIDGFTDVFVRAVEIGERDVNGEMTPMYQVSGSVQVTPEALANRYAESEDDAAEAEEEAQG